MGNGIRSGRGNMRINRGSNGSVIMSPWKGAVEPALISEKAPSAQSRTRPPHHHHHRNGNNSGSVITMKCLWVQKSVRVHRNTSGFRRPRNRLTIVLMGGILRAKRVSCTAISLRLFIDRAVFFLSVNSTVLSRKTKVLIHFYFNKLKFWEIQTHFERKTNCWHI